MQIACRTLHFLTTESDGISRAEALSVEFLLQHIHAWTPRPEGSMHQRCIFREVYLDGRRPVASSDPLFPLRVILPESTLFAIAWGSDTEKLTR